MTEIAFYHLERSSLEQALPKLLEKTTQAGKHALVMSGSLARVEWLNNILWTYESDSWLPHGAAKEGAPEQQQIWLTSEAENPNASQFLFLTDGMTVENVDIYERCFELFDGRDPTAVTSARERWKTYKEAGHQLAYWRQSELGKWEKKA